MAKLSSSGSSGDAVGGAAAADVVLALAPPAKQPENQEPNSPDPQRRQLASPPPGPGHAAAAAGRGRRELLRNKVLARALAAACLSSFATGWVIGIWGGVSAMPDFAAAFFPETSASRGQGSGHGGGAAHYCMFNDQLLSLGGSVIYLAALPALAVAARVTHAFGRLPTMWAIAWLLAVGAAIGAAAPATRAGLAAVFIGRALTGAAMGCSFQAPTMLLSELLPRHLRGQGLFTHTLAMLLGFLLSAVANQALHPYAWGWRASNALLAAPAAAMAALLPFVGESPQVLCQRGDKEAARAALAAARPPGTDISEELAQISAAAAHAAHPSAAAAGDTVIVDAADPGAGSVGAAPPAARRCRPGLLAHPPVVTASVLYPLTLMLSGLSAFSGWTPNLLLAMGASSALAYAGNTLMMVIGLVTAVIASLFVDRIGRRTLLAIGGSIIVASLATLAVLLAVYLPGTVAAPPPPAGLLPVVVALMCVNRAALSCTLQPLAVTVPAEVQPLAIRSQASALTTAVRNGSSFFFTQFALPVLCATQWGLFAIMAGLTAAGALALWLLVPETQGLALEEVHLAWARHWFWRRWEAREPPAAAKELTVVAGGAGLAAAGVLPSAERFHSISLV